MISPVTSAVLTIGIVTTDKVLSKDKAITARFVIGSGVYLFFLAAMYEGNPVIISRLALIVLVAVIFANGEGVAKTLGVL